MAPDSLRCERDAEVRQISAEGRFKEKKKISFEVQITCDLPAELRCSKGNKLAAKNGETTFCSGWKVASNFSGELNHQNQRTVVLPTCSDLLTRSVSLLLEKRRRQSDIWINAISQWLDLLVQLSFHVL